MLHDQHIQYAVQMQDFKVGMYVKCVKLPIEACGDSITQSFSK